MRRRQAVTAQRALLPRQRAQDGLGYVLDAETPAKAGGSTAQGKAAWLGGDSLEQDGAGE